MSRRWGREYWKSNQDNINGSQREESLEKEADIIVRHLNENGVEVTLEEAKNALKEKKGNRIEAMDHIQMQK